MTVQVVTSQAFLTMNRQLTWPSGQGPTSPNASRRIKSGCRRRLPGRRQISIR